MHMKTSQSNPLWYVLALLLAPILVALAFCIYFHDMAALYMVLLSLSLPSVIALLVLAAITPLVWKFMNRNRK